jgi:hypothetical protein
VIQVYCKKLPFKSNLTTIFSDWPRRISLSIAVEVPTVGVCSLSPPSTWLFLFKGIALKGEEKIGEYVLEEVEA